MTIGHLPIPKLPKTYNRKSSKLICSRNYLVGHENYQRFAKGEILFLEIKVRSRDDNLLVCLHSNHDGDWQDYSFTYQGDNTYNISFPLELVGIFQFKVRYSLNGGSSWFWDSVPYSSLFVEVPYLDQLKMYTLIPTVSGTIEQWKNELYRIKEMGFNAVHLLPVTAMDTSESPYAAKNLFAIDQSYLDYKCSDGGLAQFESFVMLAKKLEIKLCLDIVLNHVGTTSDIALHSPDWIKTDSHEPDGLKRAGCWDGANWISWRDIALIEYEHPNSSQRKKIWNYMSDYLLFWAHYAYVTGGLIRLDNMHSSNREFLKFALNRLYQKFVDIGVFAELFTDLQTVSKMVFHHKISLLLSTPWVFPFTHEFRTSIQNLHNSKDKLKYLFPINSHDSAAVSELYGASEALLPRYLLTLFLGTGASGMVQGAEWGVTTKVNFIGRNLELPKIHRDMSYDITILHKIFDQYQHTVSRGELAFVDQAHPSIIAAIRLDKTEYSALLVVANLDTNSGQDITINLQHFDFNPIAQCLWGYPKSDTIINNGWMNLSLPASSGHIFLLQSLN